MKTIRRSGRNRCTRLVRQYRRQSTRTSRTQRLDPPTQGKWSPRQNKPFQRRTEDHQSDTEQITMKARENLLRIVTPRSEVACLPPDKIENMGTMKILGTSVPHVSRLLQSTASHWQTPPKWFLSIRPRSPTPL